MARESYSYLSCSFKKGKMEKQTHYPMIVGNQEVTTGSQDLIDPATGQVFATVALGTPEDVTQAIAIAKDAQKAWGQLPVGERSAALLKFADALEQKAEDLAKLESQNTGKPSNSVQAATFPSQLIISATSPLRFGIKKALLLAVMLAVIPVCSGANRLALWGQLPPGTTLS